MAPAVLGAVREKIFRKIEYDPGLTIVWHAGEPTAIPIAWYEEAYAQLGPMPAGTFSMQSNGIAIDERWINLFLKTKTRVGLSIDGPERFHDARRRTRSNRPTWSRAMQSLHRMQDAGLNPNIITVLHPEGLSFPDEYYRFYRENGISNVSFSIDEAEGANRQSAFASIDKDEIVGFLCHLLRSAYDDGYLLYIREVERLAQILAGTGRAENEQVEPWQVFVVAFDGTVTTFSPEFMEIESQSHNNFRFGNIVDEDMDMIMTNPYFLKAYAEIRSGIDNCRGTCRYFDICGGGAPANKISENGSLSSSETMFCRLSIQASADSLMQFLHRAQSLPAPSSAH
jgi:uncharacterized protein